MIPSYFDSSTVSTAEKHIFELFKTDPLTKDWLIFHSLGLSKRISEGRQKLPYGEIDFVVCIPFKGIVCIEVKGGGVRCENGCWTTTNRFGMQDKLNRSPFLQSREGMFTLRESILTRAPKGFPNDILFCYAVIFPDISFTVKSTEWEPYQVIDNETLKHPISNAILNLIKEQRKLHPKITSVEPKPANIRIISNLIRPDFEAIVTRGVQIEQTELALLRLTEEQFDVLDLLQDNERCFFEGSAGTGKTMLALEYAKRSSIAGLRTLFICYNRLLGEWFEHQFLNNDLYKKLTVGSFHKLLRTLIMRSTIAADFCKEVEKNNLSELFEETYLLYGQLALEEVKPAYDVLVIDEGQDIIQPGTIQLLNLWLKGGLNNGTWAIFGDFNRQAIFSKYHGNVLKETLRKYAPEFAKGKLTLNCRNTRNIGEETALLSGFEAPPYRMGQIAGLPVDYSYYNLKNRPDIIICEVLKKLLVSGVRASDIIILSPLKMQYSAVNNIDGENLFKIIEVNEPAPEYAQTHLIYFATAQAFKGMESPVVLLCDITQVSSGEEQSLLYVAMSRARSQLFIILHEKLVPVITDNFRRKLQKEWNDNL